VTDLVVVGFSVW